MNVMMEMTDTGVRYTHVNGRVLEAAGEQSDGEWWCYEGDDMLDSFAAGTYERDGDEDVMMDDDGNELARLVTEDEWAAWAESMLAS
jgi:hypothetical protein